MNLLMLFIRSATKIYIDVAICSFSVSCIFASLLDVSGAVWMIIMDMDMDADMKSAL